MFNRYTPCGFFASFRYLFTLKLCRYVRKSFGLLFFLKQPRNYEGGEMYVYLKVTVDDVPKEMSVKYSVFYLIGGTHVHAHCSSLPASGPLVSGRLIITGMDMVKINKGRGSTIIGKINQSINCGRRMAQQSLSLP